MQKSSPFQIQNRFGRSIIAVCIILISFAASSCGRAHYVRGSKIGTGGYDRKVKTKAPDKDAELAKELKNFETKIKPIETINVSEADMPTGANESIENEESVASGAVAQNSSAIEEERRLPTLRKQMQDISKGQSELKSRVDKMQNDVEDIKATVGEINDAIKNIGKKTSSPKVTPGDSYEAPQKSEPSDDGLIVPDNERAPKAPKKPAAGVKKNKPVIKEVSAPVRAPKPMKIKQRKATAPADADSAEEQNRIAEQRLRSGNLQEAKAAYRNIIEKYPNSNLVPKAKKMLQQL